MREQFFSAMKKGWGFVNTNLMSNLLSGGVVALVTHELTRSYRDNDIKEMGEKNELSEKRITELSQELKAVKERHRDTKAEMMKQHTELFKCFGEKTNGLSANTLYKHPEVSRKP